MTTNPFFHQNRHQGQQDILEDLTIESIKVSGVDVYYIVRRDTPNNTNKLFGEDHNGLYDRAYLIEMYMPNAEGFEGEGDLLSKFGILVRDSGTFVVARKRFADEIPLNKPRENDLIYFPLSNTLFEIKHVATENPFYQLGKQYSYSLRVETFQYSGETFETGIPEVDKVMQEESYSLVLGITQASGAFLKNETVSSSFASGKVRQWNPTTNELKIYNVVGNFVVGDAITGALSTATGTVDIEDDMIMEDDPFAENKNIQNKADEFVDWSEESPFGRL